MVDFRMPALGADMEAGTLVAWRKKPGDRLSRGDIIAEVETDKGIIEVEVYAAGTLERLLVEPGQKVPVGTPLAVLSDAQAQPEQKPTERQHEAEAPALAPSRPELPTPLPPRASPSARRRARELGVDLATVTGHDVLTPVDVEHAAAAASEKLTNAASLSVVVASNAPQRVRVSPAARRRAQELGVDSTNLRGTGEGGAVTLADVERAQSEAKAARTLSDRQLGLRRAIAAAMARAKREIPHYYLSTTIDLGTMHGWLDVHNAEHGVRERLLAGVLLLKAVAVAAKRMPDFNARWEGEQVEPLGDVHLSVAIALRGGGLIAPAIHHADRLALPALMDALQDLVARARTGSLRSSELSDGTLTVTSLGDRGVETVFPIIYPPQTAIVGFGRIVERPWVVAGSLAVRKVVTATLAADHRVTDGHLGARFLALIDTLLQEPDEL